jgi:hypothetical protein
LFVGTYFRGIAVIYFCRQSTFITVLVSLVGGLIYYEWHDVLAALVLGAAVVFVCAWSAYEIYAEAEELFDFLARFASGFATAILMLSACVVLVSKDFAGVAAVGLVIALIDLFLTARSIKHRTKEQTSLFLMVVMGLPLIGTLLGGPVILYRLYHRSWVRADWQSMRSMATGR